MEKKIISRFVCFNDNVISKHVPVKTGVAWQHALETRPSICCSRNNLCRLPAVICGSWLACLRAAKWQVTCDAKTHTPTVSAVAGWVTGCCVINRSKVRKVCPSLRTDRGRDHRGAATKEATAPLPNTVLFCRQVDGWVGWWGGGAEGFVTPLLAPIIPFIMPLHNTHLFFETSQNLLVLIKAKVFAGTMSDTPCYLPVTGGSCVFFGAGE